MLVIAGAAVLGVLWSKHEPGEIALGRKLYADHCASCHGSHLEGEPDWKSPKPTGRMPAPPHDASGHTWHHTDQELVRITKFGMSAVVRDYESDMPAFEHVLSDREIEAVLAFIKSTWPARERKYQAERTALAKPGDP